MVTPDMGSIRLFLAMSPNVALHSFQTVVLVDGVRVPSTWGVVQIATSPGGHVVSVAMHPTRPWGRAAVTVDVPANGVVDLHYAAPWGFKHPGMLGPFPQRAAGAAFFWGWTAFALLDLLALLVLALSHFIR
jgi:hypothetical protein